MSIWNKPISLEILNATSKNTLIEHLNIIYTEVTENSISATMPVVPFHTSTTWHVAWWRFGGARGNLRFSSGQFQCG